MATPSPKLKKSDVIKQLADKLAEIPDTSIITPHDDTQFDLIAIKGVMRATTQVINQNGFTPYTKVQEEKLSKVFFISLAKSDKTSDTIHNAYRDQLRQVGIVFVKSDEPAVIFNSIAECK
jgi:hypothetical protein